MSNLLKINGINTFKQKNGFKYPKFWEYYKIHNRLHWTAEEITLSKDIQDYNDADIKEKEYIANVMKLFTQNEVIIGQGYLAMLRAFKPTEVQAMLSDFMNREYTHIENYSLFTETIGLPNSTYTDFLDIPIMATKTEYLDKARVKKYEEYKALGLTNTQIDNVYKRDLARMVAVYGGIGEGVTLLSQFASLQAYQFQNKYPGLCTINQFSIVEETLHNRGNSELFRTFIAENADIWDDELKYEIYEASREMVAYEHVLIDYLDPPHMKKEDLKQYVCYCADNALKELGMKANWNVLKNPLPFMDDVVGQMQTDFFSGRVSDYTKQITGSWSDISYDNWK
jgi:ribonucleoside-diphosphate reductase beta chain